MGGREKKLAERDLEAGTTSKVLEAVQESKEAATKA